MYEIAEHSLPPLPCQIEIIVDIPLELAFLIYAQGHRIIDYTNDTYNDEDLPAFLHVTVAFFQGTLDA